MRSLESLPCASKLLRYGFALVFLWFGFQQLTAPASWIGFLPDFVTSMPINAEAFIRVNGWMEIIGALMLITGFWTRPVSIILGLHLLAIAIETRGAIGVRDFGLAMAMFALACLPADSYTLDAWFKRQEIK